MINLDYMFKNESPTFYRDWIKPLRDAGILKGSTLIGNVPEILNNHLPEGAPIIKGSDKPVDSAIRLEKWATKQ